MLSGTVFEIPAAQARQFREPQWEIPFCGVQSKPRPSGKPRAWRTIEPTGQFRESEIGGGHDAALAPRAALFMGESMARPRPSCISPATVITARRVGSSWPPSRVCTLSMAGRNPDPQAESTFQIQTESSPRRPRPSSDAATFLETVAALSTRPAVGRGAAGHGDRISVPASAFDFARSGPVFSRAYSILADDPAKFTVQLPAGMMGKQILSRRESEWSGEGAVS